MSNILGPDRRALVVQYLKSVGLNANDVLHEGVSEEGYNTLTDERDVVRMQTSPVKFDYKEWHEWPTPDIGKRFMDIYEGRVSKLETEEEPDDEVAFNMPKEDDAPAHPVKPNEKDKTPIEVESKSVQRRKAAQKGEEPTV